LGFAFSKVRKEVIDKEVEELLKTSKLFWRSRAESSEEKEALRI
jgi:hypothetical protein